MNCPFCNTGCIENANYCHVCGSQLSSSLSEKTSQNNASFAETLKRLMPGSYVDKLLASNGRTVGERRVVTILFSDVKGSTEMGENLDPEEVLNIMNDAFGVLIAPIMKYEGTLARLMGDAILAFFGAPIAHEDDPQRACRAALEIISGAKRFSNKLAKEKGIKGFSVRVGINTGLVVVAEVGADFRVEYTAMGDAVNVASRMESAAEPGTILITEDTRKLLPEDFEFEPIGSIQVKGRKTPVIAFRVLSENSHSALPQTCEFKNSPLVGRTAELEEIIQILKKVKAGNKGKIISIYGDCGAGKSRLATEIRKLTSHELQWVEIRSLAYQHNNSYWLIKNLLKKHLAVDTANNGNLKSLIQQKMKLSQKKSSGIYSIIAYLMDIQEETLPFHYDINDAESLKGQIQYSVKEYFKSNSFEKPLILLLEDLQWCDPASLELVTELYSLTIKYPLVIFNTFRKGENCIWDVHMQSLELYRNNYTPIVLNPLCEKESRELLHNIAGELQIGASLENDILKRTEGNPFFIEQILKAYIERSLYKKINNENTSFIEQDTEIPNLLQSVIMSRLDFLSPNDKLILQTASVIGRNFNQKLLVNIFNSSISESEVTISLKQLVNRDFIQILDPKEYIPGSPVECTFTQSLIQEVAYNSLLISNREKTHLAAGETIEKYYPHEAQEMAGTLGIHFEKGKNYKKAVHYYKTAADKAKNIFANKEAIILYNKITGLAELYPADNVLLCEVNESLGDINSLISEYSRAIEGYETAIRLTENIRKKGVLYQKCGQVYEKWGQYENAVRYYDQSLKYEKDINDEVYSAQAYIGKGMVYYRQGDLVQAELYSRHALILLKDHSNTYQLSECYNNIGIIYARMGDFNKSETFLLKALDIRVNICSLSGLAASYNNLGFLSQLQENMSQAVEYYTSSLEYCEKTGNIHGLAKIYDNISQLYIIGGEREKAISYNLMAMEILGRLTFKSSEINQHLWLQSGVW